MCITNIVLVVNKQMKYTLAKCDMKMREQGERGRERRQENIGRTSQGLFSEKEEELCFLEREIAKDGNRKNLTPHQLQIRRGRRKVIV